MTESWLLVAGLTAAASMHCVGMCGGFVVAVAAPPGRRPAMTFFDQLLLHLGKATSYAFLGALVGNAGAAITSSAAIAWGGRALALAAGVAILLGGLSLLGLSRLTGGGGWIGALWAAVMARLVSTRRLGSSLVLGLAMGFLPCPLVYAGLGAAAATASPLKGMAIMAGVALGTIPALAVVAAFGSVIPLAFRKHMARAAGVMLVVAGALTVARGLNPHACHGSHGPSSGGEHDQPGCCSGLPGATPPESGATNQDAETPDSSGRQSPRASVGGPARSALEPSQDRKPTPGYAEHIADAQPAPGEAKRPSIRRRRSV